MDAKKPPEGGFLMYILPLSNGDFIQKRDSIWERLNRRFYEAVMSVRQGFIYQLVKHIFLLIDKFVLNLNFDTHRRKTCMIF